MQYGATSFLSLTLIFTNYIRLIWKKNVEKNLKKTVVYILSLYTITYIHPKYLYKNIKYDNEVFKFT